MSGPKLSEAELERIRMEQLERERQEALRRLKEARNNYQEACSKVSDLKSHVDEMLSQMDESYRSHTKAEADKILQIFQTNAVIDTKSEEDYKTATDFVNRALQEAARKQEALFEKTLQRSKTDAKLVQASQIQQSFQTVVNERGKKVGTVQIDFQCQYDEEKLKEQLMVLLLHLRNQEKKTEIQNLRLFSRKAADQLENILENENLLKQRQAVYGNMQQIVNEEQELIRIYKEKKALYDDYFALAAMTDTKPRNPEDFKEAKELQQEIKKLRYLFRKQDEMDYIANQINEAMVELGYTFVVSKVLTRKNGGEMDFSLYEADDETGIAVYTDQSGAVMMRMTVLGDDPAITDDDREFSYQRQIDFCAGHPDLVEALAARGVFLKQKEYKEPDRNHTYKIDRKAYKGNTIQQGTQTALKRQKIDRRRRRRASKKMRAL